MQIHKLFADAVGAGAGWSERSKHHALADMLTRAGHPIGARATEKWSARGNIPMRWLPIIVGAAGAEGRTINLNDYL
jgi:hypothetical protein